MPVKITPDDLALGFVIAARAIAPAMQRMELATLVAAFAIVGDVLTAFGVTEAQLVGLARESAQLSSPPALY